MTLQTGLRRVLPGGSDIASRALGDIAKLGEYLATVDELDLAVADLADSVV